MSQRVTFSLLPNKFSQILIALIIPMFSIKICELLVSRHSSNIKFLDVPLHPILCCMQSSTSSPVRYCSARALDESAEPSFILNRWKPYRWLTEQRYPRNAHPRCSDASPVATNVANYRGRCWYYFRFFGFGGCNMGTKFGIS